MSIFSFEKCEKTTATAKFHSIVDNPNAGVEGQLYREDYRREIYCPQEWDSRRFQYGSIKRALSAFRYLLQHASKDDRYTLQAAHDELQEELFALRARYETQDILASSRDAVKDIMQDAMKDVMQDIFTPEKITVH